MAILPLLASGLLALALAPAVSRAQGALVSAERPAEFMVYQYPETVLLLRMDLPGAGFSMATFGPEGARLKASAVPGRRLGPVYQYIDSEERPRQLMIEIKPERPVERSAIRFELLQLRPDDPNFSRLAQAYRQYSLGLETPAADDPNSWMVKAYSLSNAADAFAWMGMEEMRLWSEYFAAHLVLHRLGDRLTAAEAAEEIGQAARRAGFDGIELAAAALEADARVALLDGAPAGSISGAAARQADEALQRLAGLAATAGLGVEQGRAVFRQAGILERQGENEQALERYAEAERLLGNTTDVELLAEVRNASASLYERTGDTTGALAVLDRATGEAPVAELTEAGPDRVQALFDRGRLLNRAGRHREAAEALTEALALPPSRSGSELRGPITMELAWSRYALAEDDEAAGLAEQGLAQATAATPRELRARTWGVLANRHRARGEADEASRARKQQLAALEGGAGTARALYQQALDALAGPPSDPALADRLLARSAEAARAEQDPVAERMARLLRCARTVRDCGEQNVRGLAGDLAAYGLPSAAAEGHLRLAQWLAGAGQVAGARRETAALLANLHAQATMLPGALEPWLQQRYAELASDYLQQAAATGDPVESLLALEQLRRVEAARYGRVHGNVLDTGRDDALRDVLARAEDARGEEAIRLGEAFWRSLAEAGRSCPACAARAWPGRADVEESLAGLLADETLLVYDFSGPEIRVLRATRRGAERVVLPGSDGLRSRLDGFAARATPTVSLADLDRLGDDLLKPLGRLERRIYLLPAGPLRGVPFDALRRGGRFLAEDHVVVSLSGLDALDRRSGAVPADYRERVFLGGAPSEGRDPFDFDVPLSTEVSALSELFVGPGLHVVQGIAFARDEFQDERFETARLIHLGAPGRIDLARPDRSRIRLADEGPGAGSDGLAAGEIRGFRLDANLVVLSRTGITGSPGRDRRAPSTRLALAQDFLDAGAGQVVYTLWAPPERAATRWLRAFYGALDEGGATADGLAKAKRSVIESGAPENFEAWAGFQLLIR